MAERRIYDEKLVKIGALLATKRKSLGIQYKNRERFIDLRSEEIFGGDAWISPRHLANIELGKNWISFEKFFLLATALEVDPTELFDDIRRIYNTWFFAIILFARLWKGEKLWLHLQ